VSGFSVRGIFSSCFRIKPTYIFRGANASGCKLFLTTVTYLITITEITTFKTASEYLDFRKIVGAVM
jgi:hypothetical protein